MEGDDPDRILEQRISTIATTVAAKCEAAKAAAAAKKAAAPAAPIPVTEPTIIPVPTPVPTPVACMPGQSATTSTSSGRIIADPPRRSARQRRPTARAEVSYSMSHYGLTFSN